MKIEMRADSEASYTANDITIILRQLNLKPPRLNLEARQI